MNTPSSRISLVVGLPGDRATRRQVNDLHKKVGATTGEALPLIHGFTVSLPEGQLDSYLASLPENATVMRNEPFYTPPMAAASRSPDVGDEELEMAAPPEGKELPEQPYLSRPHGWEALRSQGVDGRGVTLAVIDSGLAPHADFGNRVKAFKNFGWTGSATAGDDYGHGTDVASVAAGDGPVVDGVAPGLSLVGARITSPSEAIKAIDWVIEHKEEYGIGVLNLSLGADASISSRLDPFAQATQRAIDAGILTVVAAGNECREDVCAGTISTPGILADAITVGAYNDGRTSSLEDDTMYGHSSRGPTKPDGLSKPDLVAPGVNVLGVGAPGSELRNKRPRWAEYIVDSGTSLATPMVGGALALMLQVHPGLTQKEAKAILQSTAIPLPNVDGLAQGAGRMNLGAAVDEARRLAS